MFRALYRVFDYDGRSSRWEYWSFWLGCIVLGICLGLGIPIIFGNSLDYAVANPDDATTLTISIGALLLILPLLSLRVRRFHDFGWSGWASLLLFMPVVNLVIELMLLFRGPIREPAELVASAEPRHVNIYNSTHATAADSVHSQTIHVHQIEKLADMHNRGLLTAEEFANAKTRLLSQM